MYIMYVSITVYTGGMEGVCVAFACMRVCERARMSNPTQIFGNGNLKAVT